MTNKKHQPWCIMNMQLQKEVIYLQKHLSCENFCRSHGEKRCEIKGGSQEMAVITAQWQKFY